MKTLSDPNRRSVNFTPGATSVKALRKKDAPPSLSTDTHRLAGVEEQVFSVRAEVTTATIEDDSDIHLVIAQPGASRRTMIVEFPHPGCVAKPFNRVQIRRARRAILRDCGPISSSSFTDLKGTVTITGVGFWDEDHGQTGVAPNAIELHPVLSFAGSCLHR